MLIFAVKEFYYGMGSLEPIVISDDFIGTILASYQRGEYVAVSNCYFECEPTSVMYDLLAFLLGHFKITKVCIPVHFVRIIERPSYVVYEFISFDSN